MKLMKLPHSDMCTLHITLPIVGISIYQCHPGSPLICEVHMCDTDTAREMQAQATLNQKALHTWQLSYPGAFDAI
jgi:hypothetical protein